MEGIEILTGGLEMIGKISTDWTALCNEGASSTPFFRPEWFAGFVRNFEKRVDLVTVNLDGRLRAVLPLVKKRAVLNGLPVRKLQAVYNLNTQRFDLIHGAGETDRKYVVRSIWETISKTRGWDVLELRLVPRDSWLADMLSAARDNGHRTGIWQMDAAPYITVPVHDDAEKGLEDFFCGPRKHFGKELRRRQKRLSEVGHVTFSVSTMATPELLKRYFDLESKGWKGRGGTAATDDPSVARMHEEFAGDMAGKGMFLAYEMRLDDKIIAMSLNIRADGTMIHWKTSYDEEYSRYSPGNQLFRELLKDCIRDRIAEIDLLSPSTPNKRVWATGEREHVAFYIFRKGLVGSLLWAWKFRVIDGLRALRSKEIQMRTAEVHG